jgi:hypothetical protein
LRSPPPSVDLVDEGQPIRNAAVEALSKEDAELKFRQIDPAAALTV